MLKFYRVATIEDLSLDSSRDILFMRWREIFMEPATP